MLNEESTELIENGREGDSLEGHAHTPMYNPHIIPLINLSQSILVKTRRVLSYEHGTKVETGWYSPINLVGQDSTKSIQCNFKFNQVYSVICKL